MANFMLTGPAALTLDGKGRIAMPARHRVTLEGMKVRELTVTKHPEGALLIFPRPAWENFLERISTLGMEAQGWKRVFLGNAVDVELDASGRLLIAPELRVGAGLTRDVMLIGVGTHFELWDAERHAAYEAKVIESPMPEVLKNFIL